MIKYYLLSLLFSISLLSYAQEKIRIDPSRSYGGSVSEYFEDIEYIPLETTKESLFGDINQMVITDNTIVVYDNDTKSILFFTMKGKYIRKIAVKNSSYVSLSKGKNGDIIVSTSKNTKKGSVLVENIYSIDGIKKSQLKINSFEDGLIKIDDGYFLSGGSCNYTNNPKDSVYHLINIYKGDVLYKSLLPYNQKLYAGFCKLGGTIPLKSNNSKITDNSILISTPYEHIVYKVTKDTALRMFQFVFPTDWSISANILNSNNPKLIDSVYQQINRNGSRIIQDVRNIEYYNDNILFKITPKSYIRAAGSTATQQYNFIYNTLSTKLISIERLTSDEKNYFLPIIGNGPIAVFDGLYFHQGTYYTPISSLEMFNTQQANKSKNVFYSSVLQEYFKTQNRKSNPVIVRMKLKD